MYREVLFIQILFVTFMFVCSDNRTYEDRAEYVDEVVSLNDARVKKNLTKLWRQQPMAIVVELKEPLLENLKSLWEKENEMTFPISKILLGTFDSRGLQDKFVYNETSKFLQAILDLKASAYDRRMFTPTMHVLNDLLQENLTDGSILLITRSKPSDDDFVETLAESLMRRKCQLSVLWMGEQPEENYTELKSLTRRTGGQFELMSDDTSYENESSDNFYQNVEQIQDVSSRLRFPEELKDSKDEGEDAPMVSRTASQKAWQKITVPLIVEVQSGANLEMRPGTPTQIPFTVKNNLNSPVQVGFSAKFNGIFQSVQPPQTVLPPFGSATVIVNMQPFSNAQTDAVGKLTLFAAIPNKVTPRSALIFMNAKTSTDTTEPKIYYKYEGDCSNYKEPQNCENGNWGLSATFHDEDSGLLKILSEPYGLIFQSEFVAGTKSPVTVYYTATCCQPHVQIWAEDLRGNYVKKSFDVFNQTLLAGEIATIVLGVLLLLFIIIAIIAAVVFVRRRNRRNMIIPRPRTESR